MTDRQLQSYLLHAILVAGKNDDFAYNALTTFLSKAGDLLPFEYIRFLLPDLLGPALREAKVGNYNKNTKAFAEVASSNLDLRTCSVDDLDSIHGIGPKTARFFVLYSREDAEVAVIDTHMLKYLKSKNHELPPTLTPKKYLELEKILLADAKAQGKTPRVFDAEIWDYYSGAPDLAAKWRGD